MHPEDKIPEQESGAQSNTESEAVLPDEENAKTFFKTVRNRLLQVNGWQALAGAGTAEFQLCDGHGNEVPRNARPGDYFRIDIPGPGSATGGGDDWVRIEAIDDEPDCVLIRVRPASNPQNSNPDIAHFFSEEATSNFLVRREGNRVIAGEYGRNEKPNTSAQKIGDKILNAAVAT